MIIFQVWRTVAIFLQPFSFSGLPVAIQVRPRLSPLPGVPRPKHAQTGSGTIRLGGSLALPVKGRISDGE